MIRTKSEYPAVKPSTPYAATLAGEGIQFKENAIMMNNSMKKLLSVIACMVLIAAVALFATGCTESGNETTPPTEVVTEAGTQGAETPEPPEAAVLGEGATVFTVVTADLDGVETTWEIRTDASTVGEALLAVELIAGEDGPYGLYIKTVNGITLDYDTDGKYWAFYIDGEYGLTGVDSTEIDPAAVYSFKPE